MILNTRTSNINSPTGSALYTSDHKCSQTQNFTHFTAAKTALSLPIFQFTTILAQIGSLVWRLNFWWTIKLSTGQKTWPASHRYAEAITLVTVCVRLATQVITPAHYSGDNLFKQLLNYQRNHLGCSKSAHKPKLSRRCLIFLCANGLDESHSHSLLFCVYRLQ